MRDVRAIVTERGAGCDGRLRRQVVFHPTKRRSVRRSRVVLAPRPWRYAGGKSRRQRGQKRPLPRGERV